jgi:dipeptidyl aminopeptidase/acylaminoacyl peptidase
MNRLRWCAIALPLVFAAAAPRPCVAQGRRPITETDLFKFVWAADPRISPNGSQVAFVLVNVNEDKDRYETQIYVVPSDGSAPPRPLTSGRNDRSPRWSPNGREIAFVRAPEPVDGKPKPAQIYLISMDGGEARSLTDAPKGASSPVWSPDGRTIAFVSTPDSSSAQAKADSANKLLDSTRKKHITDVRVITRAQYRWKWRRLHRSDSAQPYLDRARIIYCHGWSPDYQADHLRRVRRRRAGVVARCLASLLHVEPAARALLRIQGR